jgi:hypothetical protein
VLNTVGNKTREWQQAKRVLKPAFEDAGITECELRLDANCWRNNGLSWAHSKKRGDIRGGELYEVVVGCAYCHTMIEGMPKDKMTKLVREVIAKRTRQPVLPEGCY